MINLISAVMTVVLTLSLTGVFSDTAPCEDQTYNYANGILTPAPRTMPHLPICQ